jgi:adenylosuccinate synthase
MSVAPLAVDKAEFDREISLLYDDAFLDNISERFAAAGRLLTVVNPEYLGEVILARNGIAVVEASHGVLTDRSAGFHPHTSAIRTLPSFSLRMLLDAGFSGQIIDIGVTRAYAIRHGAGPLPTYDPKMVDYLLPGSAKDENRYQGKVRVGPLDFVLLRYAIEASGGPSYYDGLAVTCFDQILAGKVWKVCNKYANSLDPAYFTPSGAIRVDHGNSDAHFEHQTALGHKLLDCEPEITNLPINPSASRDDLYAVCAATMEEAVAVPVRMVAFGPTELDKICK